MSKIANHTERAALLMRRGLSLGNSRKGNFAKSSKSKVHRKRMIISPIRMRNYRLPRR